ncbi:MAG: hypothetical protein QM778_27305 [Myxococcales bacterium]
MALYLRALALGWAIWVSTAGCGAATTQATLASGSPGLALTNAAVAVVAQASTGCRFQGCPYGSFCNMETGFCEVKKCGDGCPGNTVCNEGLNRCQAPPPPKTPTDFLPQDNQLNNYNPLGGRM